MLYLQEVTEWNASYTVHNHIYYVNDRQSKMVGYIPNGSKRVKFFSKPISFDRRGRKFIKVLDRKAEKDSVYFEEQKVAKSDAKTHTVQGSRGSTYIITENAGRFTCSCPGFMFRNKCKHVEEFSKR